MIPPVSKYEFRAMFYLLLAVLQIDLVWSWCWFILAAYWAYRGALEGE